MAEFEPDKIEKIIKDKKRFQKLVVSSRNYYDKNLNWDTWGQKMALLFNSLLK